MSAKATPITPPRASGTTASSIRSTRARPSRSPSAFHSMRRFRSIASAYSGCDRMTYSTFRLENKGPVAQVTLDRPSVKNAFDDVLIRELTDALGVIAKDDSVRVMVLTGAGDVFSAGADLNWMKKVSTYTFDQNVEDALVFARML